MLRFVQPIVYRGWEAYYHDSCRAITGSTILPLTVGKKQVPVGYSKKAKYFVLPVICVCGWLYDPEFGDPESGVPPGTPFEDLPRDCLCPVCWAGKDSFRKLD